MPEIYGQIPGREDSIVYEYGQEESSYSRGKKAHHKHVFPDMIVETSIQKFFQVQKIGNQIEDNCSCN